MIVLKQVIKYPNANVLEATWVDSEGAVVRCHAYADVQMDDLIADLGEDVEQYADLIAEVRTNIQPPEPPSAEAVAALVEEKKKVVRQAREGILNRLAGIALAAKLEDDNATAQAYLVVRSGLLNITSNLPSDPELVDAVVMQRYAVLVSQCTPQMIGAFAQVDA